MPRLLEVSRIILVVVIFKSPTVGLPRTNFLRMSCGADIKRNWTKFFGYCMVAIDTVNFV